MNAMEKNLMLEMAIPNEEADRMISQNPLMCPCFHRNSTAREQRPHRDFWGISPGVFKRSEKGNHNGDNNFGYLRQRVTCPECGRRMIARVQVGHDGDHVAYLLPPHKRKKWWKKGVKMKKGSC
jgi:hypothetical protein